MSSETPTRLLGDPEEHIHEFLLVTADGSPRGPLLARAEIIEHGWPTCWRAGPKPMSSTS
jgi:hypothetical protein